MTEVKPQQHLVSGRAAVMTVIAMGLCYAIPATDPTILSTNISRVRIGLDTTTSTASFIASLATLTMAATVLGAGALGDLYGMRRMLMIGLLGAIACGALAAAAPTAALLMVARACTGVAFAFLLGLSLAMINAVFPPGRRAAAIALYLGAGCALATPLPAIGSVLVAQIGWRASFLVAPVVAVVALAMTQRYVPETPRTSRRPDVVGLVLVGVALLGLIYGISALQPRINAGSVAAILVGLVAAAGFVARQLRTPDPALDLQIFRSSRFNAAVTAGVTSNFVSGGLTIVLAFYLVTVRSDSPEVLAFLLIPATLLAALAAVGAGSAATRFGDRSVLVTGLVVQLAGLLMLSMVDQDSSLAVVFAAVALNAVGGAIVQTPQATIMMASAPAELGGAVAAVKCGVGQAGYSLGPALFALVGITLFLQYGTHKLAASGITGEHAREALRLARGGVDMLGSSHVVDPSQARLVVAEATQSMLDAIHTLSLIMAVAPVAAIALALILLRPERRRSAAADS